jgi:hypothetical protein
MKLEYFKDDLLNKDQYINTEKIKFYRFYSFFKLKYYMKYFLIQSFCIKKVTQ